VVGSSSSTIGVSCASTIASHTRWRWPPESSSTARGEVVDPRRAHRLDDRALVDRRPLAQDPLVRVAPARDEVGDGDRIRRDRALGEQAEAAGDLLGGDQSAKAAAESVMRAMPGVGAATRTTSAMPVWRGKGRGIRAP
jgi:hypothetical protein